MNDLVKRLITVLLVDHYALSREGLVKICSAEPDMHVVGEAADTDEAISMVQRTRPDVVLLDADIPGGWTEDLIRNIGRTSPSSRVVILIARDDIMHINRILGSGAHAYVLKSATRAEFTTIIRGVKLHPERVLLSISRNMFENLRARTDSVLSGRELEVLTLVAVGKSNAEIAATLYLSPGTVKRHLTNIYAKLGAGSRIDAVNKAIENGSLAPRDIRR